MTRRVVRAVLFLVMVASLGAAGWFGFDTLQSLQRDRAAFDAFEREARRATANLADTRASLQAYVAIGQGTAFWTARVAQNIKDWALITDRLRQLALDAGALNDLDAAGTTMTGFVALNDRAARLVRNDLISQASQVIFGEGRETLAAAAARIDTALRSERGAMERRAQEKLQQIEYALAGTAGVCLFTAAVLLFFVPRTKAIDLSVEETTESSAGPHTVGLESRAIEQDPVVSEPGAAAVPAAEVAVARDAAPRIDRRKATELKGMAELCGDFARVADSVELPGLLERAARLIDASGFIVWVADPGREELRPALAHGYAPQALARIPPIPRDADNATAAAWRQAELKIVRTNGMTPGAVVAPMLTSTGCIGVLAAEIRHGRESNETNRALTRILAAQLATLVDVPQAAADEPEVPHHAHG